MKFLTTIYFFLFPYISWGCAACADSMNNHKDAMTTKVVVVFILITYIPLYFIYRVIKRGSNSSLAILVDTKDEEIK